MLSEVNRKKAVYPVTVPIDATIQYAADYDRDTGAVLSIDYEWFGGNFAGITNYFFEALEITPSMGLRFTLGHLCLEIVDRQPERAIWTVARVL